MLSNWILKSISIQILLSPVFLFKINAMAEPQAHAASHKAEETKVQIAEKTSYNEMCCRAGFFVYVLTSDLNLFVSTFC